LGLVAPLSVLLLVVVPAWHMGRAWEWWPGSHLDLVLNVVAWVSLASVFPMAIVQNGITRGVLFAGLSGLTLAAACVILVHGGLGRLVPPLLLLFATAALLPIGRARHRCPQARSAAYLQIGLGVLLAAGVLGVAVAAQEYRDRGLTGLVQFALQARSEIKMTFAGIGAMLLCLMTAAVASVIAGVRAKPRVLTTVAAWCARASLGLMVPLVAMDDMRRAVGIPSVPMVRALGLGMLAAIMAAGLHELLTVVIFGPIARTSKRPLPNGSTGR
jgi:hypothetical protein